MCHLFNIGDFTVESPIKLQKAPVDRSAAMLSQAQCLNAVPWMLHRRWGCTPGSSERDHWSAQTSSPQAVLTVGQFLMQGFMNYPTVDTNVLNLEFLMSNVFRPKDWAILDTLKQKIIKQSPNSHQIHHVLIQGCYERPHFETAIKPCFNAASKESQVDSWGVGVGVAGTDGSDPWAVFKDDKHWQPRSPVASLDRHARILYHVPMFLAHLLHAQELLGRTQWNQDLLWVALKIQLWKLL